MSKSLTFKYLGSMHEFCDRLSDLLREEEEALLAIGRLLLNDLSDLFQQFLISY